MYSTKYHWWLLISDILGYQSFEYLWSYLSLLFIFSQLETALTLHFQNVLEAPYAHCAMISASWKVFPSINGLELWLNDGFSVPIVDGPSLGYMPGQLSINASHAR